jgi:hypothetical protein
MPGILMILCASVREDDRAMPARSEYCPDSPDTAVTLP